MEMRPVMCEKQERASVAALLLGETGVAKTLVVPLLLGAAVACAQLPESSQEAQMENAELPGPIAIDQDDTPGDRLVTPDLSSFAGQLTAILNRIPQGQEGQGSRSL